MLGARSIAKAWRWAPGRFVVVGTVGAGAGRAVVDGSHVSFVDPGSMTGDTPAAPNLHDGDGDSGGGAGAGQAGSSGAGGVGLQRVVARGFDGPRAGVDVLVHDAEGTLRGRAKTAADGVANVAPLAGGSVTFVYEEKVFQTKAVRTYFGLDGSFEFTQTIDDEPFGAGGAAGGPPSMRVRVAPSSPAPGPEHYTIALSCRDGATSHPSAPGAPAFEDLSFRGCGGDKPYDVLVLALDAADVPLAYGIVLGAPFQAGGEATHNVVADRTDLVKRTYAAQNAPASFTQSLPNAPLVRPRRRAPGRPRRRAVVRRQLGAFGARRPHLERRVPHGPCRDAAPGRATGRPRRLPAGRAGAVWLRPGRAGRSNRPRGPGGLPSRRFIWSRERRRAATFDRLVLGRRWRRAHGAARAPPASFRSSRRDATAAGGGLNGSQAYSAPLMSARLSALAHLTKAGARPALCPAPPASSRPRERSGCPDRETWRPDCEDDVTRPVTHAPGQNCYPSFRLHTPPPRQ